MPHARVDRQALGPLAAAPGDDGPAGGFVVVGLVNAGVLAGVLSEPGMDLGICGGGSCGKPKAEPGEENHLTLLCLMLIIMSRIKHLPVKPRCGMGRRFVKQR